MPNIIYSPRLSGDPIKDDEGFLNKEDIWKKNTKENGQFHSVWLSMMYPRLFLAKNLLKEDGVIFVSIDDNEVENLKLLLSSVFGQENFIASLARRTKSGGGSASHHFAIEHDYIIAFARSKDLLPQMFIAHDEQYLKRYSEEDKDGKYFWDTMERSYTQTKPYKIKAPDNSLLTGKWFRSEQRFKDDLKNGEVKFLQKEDKSWSVQFKQRLPEGKKMRTILNEKEFKSSQSDLEEIGFKSIFSFPKPTFLIKKLIEVGTNDNDIILDFFAGSASTAQAVLDFNKEDGGKRKFICVQMPEPTPEDSEARKAGYETISQIAQDRIKKVIEKVKKEAPIIAETMDLGFKSFKLQPSNFKTWRNDITGQKLSEQIEAFTNPYKEGTEALNMLYEIILKAGLPLTIPIEQSKIGKHILYKIDGGKMIIALEAINTEILSEILQAKPRRFVTLDKLFNKQDELLTNTRLQLQEAEIDFQII